MLPAQLFAQIALARLSFSCLHMNFKIVFPTCLKCITDILMEIVLKPQITFDNTAIVMLLILPIHKYSKSLHHLWSPFSFIVENFHFLGQIDFQANFETVVNGIVFLISFSAISLPKKLLINVQKKTIPFLLILSPAALLNLFTRS